MAERPPEDDSNSIAHLFSRLIDDAERFVRAEIRLYRAEFLSRVGEARMAIVLGVVALLLAQSSIIAMVLGLLLVLRHPLGEVWATIVVVVVSLGIAALLVRIAVSKVRKITEIKDKPERESPHDR
ncbi:MAG: phage holin family protein [Sphingomonas sp.]